VPAAFLLGAPETPASELVAFCRTRLAGFKVPRSIWWVRTLPVNAAGKVAKQVLRSEAARRVGG
jgi:acyl-CoA synthetase (AMP-forming)/AMP-acid ligase II